MTLEDTTPVPDIPVPLHGTASFARKVSDGNYGVSEAFLSVQFDISDSTDITAAARDAFLEAKAVVLEQLGIEQSISESGIVTEVITRAFPGTVVQGATASDRQAVADNRPPWDAKTTNADEKRANADWAKARFATNPEEFFDNRADKASGKSNPKAPDIKHKASQVGVWF